LRRHLAPYYGNMGSSSIDHRGNLIPYWTGETLRAGGGGIDERGNKPVRGALAVLLAVQRGDIASIRTVPGNLDDEFINRLHVCRRCRSRKTRSISPRVLRPFPQVHFSGAGDSVVPPVVAQRFVRATGGRCAQARTVGKIAHDGDLEPVLAGPVEGDACLRRSARTTVAFACCVRLLLKRI
jgi:hypothetical protein